jgi:hypothetical protein
MFTKFFKTATHTHSQVNVKMCFDQQKKHDSNKEYVQGPVPMLTEQPWNGFCPVALADDDDGDKDDCISGST